MTGNFRSFDENGQMIRTGRSGEGRRGVVSAGRAEAAAIGRDILRQGGIDNCDAVAAVSEDDSVNLMAAQLAKNIFRRDKVICRVSDPHLQILYHKAYELETICPTVLTEQAVFRALSK